MTGSPARVSGIWGAINQVRESILGRYGEKLRCLLTLFIHSTSHPSHPSCLPSIYPSIHPSIHPPTQGRGRSLQEEVGGVPRASRGGEEGVGEEDVS